MFVCTFTSRGSFFLVGTCIFALQCKYNVLAALFVMGINFVKMTLI